MFFIRSLLKIFYIKAPDNISSGAFISDKKHYAVPAVHGFLCVNA